MLSAVSLVTSRYQSRQLFIELGRGQDAGPRTRHHFPAPPQAGARRAGAATPAWTSAARGQLKMIPMLLDRTIYLNQAPVHSVEARNEAAAFLRQPCAARPAAHVAGAAGADPAVLRVHRCWPARGAVPAGLVHRIPAAAGRAPLRAHADPVRPRHGKILDRNGVVLPCSVPARAIWAIPDDVKQATPTQITALAGLLDMPAADLRRRWPTRTATSST